MKTLTITIYRIYGTDQLCADVSHRGKLLASYDRNHVLSWSSLKQGLINKCKAYGASNGFTRYKIVDLT